MTRRSAAFLTSFLTAFLLAFAMGAHAEPDVTGNRGAMLYDTHCIACHTTEVHWRDKRLVTDWHSLTAQVRRWQGNTGLNWDENDIKAVADYLNRLYYHLPSGKSNEIAKHPR